MTRELGAIAADQGKGFVDAPLSGGQAGAENGVLSIMCGGQADHYAQVEPILQSYARICRLLGGPGSGQLAKMMNQICIAGLVQGLAEALAFGQKAGLDGAAVVEVISQGAAGSWHHPPDTQQLNRAFGANLRLRRGYLATYERGVRAAKNWQIVG